MAEKKSLVIKIKRPTLKPEAEIQPAMVTQWHKPRIIMAVMIVLGLLAVSVYLLTGRSSSENSPAQPKPAGAETESRIKPPSDTVNNQPAIAPPQPTEKKQAASRAAAERPSVNTDKQPAANAARLPNKPIPVKSDSRVKRAVLTQALNGREPGKAMANTVTVGKNKPVTVYYFTELRDMAGQKIYQVWLHDGKAVARYEHEVAADRWRTFSHRRLTTKARGAWQVKTIDEQGRLLNEKSFLVK